MVGMLDQMMLGYQQPGGGGFPASPRDRSWLMRMLGLGQPTPEPTLEELATAAAPAMGPIAGMGPLGGIAQPRPFERGAPPMMAPGVGMMSQLAPQARSMPTTGPGAVTSLDGGPIPLPRRDPRSTTEMGSRAVATQSPGAPMSLAPPAPPMAAAPSRGGGLMGSGREPSAAFLMALGGGFAGAPSLGTAMRRGFTQGAAVSQTDETRRQALDLQAASQADIYRALKSAGAPDVQIMAALRNPTVLKELSDKYLGGGEKPPSGYRRLPDGNLTFIEGGPADPKVARALTNRQNVPSGYRYVNPDDPNSPLEPIPNGPATKLPTDIAGKLALMNEAMKDLPDARRVLMEGRGSAGTGITGAAASYTNIGDTGRAQRTVRTAIEAALRAMTGAAAPETEVKRYEGMFMPSPWDSPKTAKQKLDQLEGFMRRANEMVGQGRGIPAMPPASAPAAAPSSGRTKAGIPWHMEGA